MATYIFGSTLEELQQLCAQQGWPRFVARQLCEWMYGKRVTEFAQMTNLSKSVRQYLEENYTIERNYPVECAVSKDGTKKYLFRETDDKGQEQYVEAVMIPDGDRATLCVSCQMGCQMACSFCVTGRQGFHGNLSTAQILNQLFAIPESSRLTNVVYMGMGEPMNNYLNVLHSTQVLTEKWGWGWSPTRITVSSVGVVDKLQRFIEESHCHIAVSLHNPFANERASLMPAQKTYPLDKVLDMLRQYEWTGQRRLSFEYTLFGGLNDTPRHAAELVRLLHGLNCRVNLIRFHASPLTPYHTSTPDALRTFQDYLNQQNITCTLRASRGEDIQAACGLLAGKAKEKQQ